MDIHLNWTIDTPFIDELMVKNTPNVSRLDFLKNQILLSLARGRSKGLLQVHVNLVAFEKRRRNETQ